MNDTTIVDDADLVITQNKLEWDRLCFLLNDTETNVLWINCDTGRIKSILPRAISHFFPQLRPYNIYLNSDSVSLNVLLLGDKEGFTPKNSIIHVFGLEEAIKNPEFLGNLNFQRDSTFRDTPATIIFWADITTSTTLIRKAYDFWSWIVFSFDFNTPSELLTARQKGFNEQLLLEENVIKMPQKDSSDRIKHLELEWADFLKSVNGQPSTVKQMKDAVTLAMALAKEYREDGVYNKAIALLEYLLNIGANLIEESSLGLIWNELGVNFNVIEDYGLAKFYLEKANNIVDGLYGVQSLNKATVLSNLSVALLGQENFIKAKEFLVEALDIYKHTNILFHPNKVRDMFNLSNVYMHLKDYYEAKKLLENALKSINNDDMQLPPIYSGLATIAMIEGNYEYSKEYYNKAIDILKLNFGESNYRLASHYFNLANVYRQLGEKANAKAYMNKALQLIDDCLKPDNTKFQYAHKFLKELE